MYYVNHSVGLVLHVEDVFSSSSSEEEEEDSEKSSAEEEEDSEEESEEEQVRVYWLNLFLSCFIKIKDIGITPLVKKNSLKRITNVIYLGKMPY